MDCCKDNQPMVFAPPRSFGLTEIPEEVAAKANEFVTPIMDARRLRVFYQLLADLESIEGGIVDIGCGEGKTSVFLWYCMEMLSIDRKLYLFDAFPAVPELIGKCQPLPEIRCDEEVGMMEVHRNFKEMVGYVPDSYEIFPGWFSETLEKCLPAKVAFAHIDCDVAESLELALRQVYYRLQPGGICVIDDYGLAFLPCVKPTVDAFLKDKPEKLESTVGGIQAAFVKCALEEENEPET